MSVMKTNKGVEFLVDDDVYELIKDRTWRIDYHGYIYYERKLKGKKIRTYLHKILCPTEEGFLTDHRNGDPLDNRRENLRPATPSQSTVNTRRCGGGTSVYKGVYKSKHSYKDKTYEYWRVMVKKDGKVVFRGTYKTEIEAAKAYDKVAKEVHGEYARLNFPDL